MGARCDATRVTAATAFASADTPYPMIVDHVHQALEDYFRRELERPDLQPIRQQLRRVQFHPATGCRAEYVDRVMNAVVALARRRRIALEWEPYADALIERASADTSLGGRGIGNLIEHAVINPLARQLCESKRLPWRAGRARRLQHGSTGAAGSTLQLRVEPS